MSKFNVGDRVRFLGTDIKRSCFYPSIGTVGVVDIVGETSCRCKWPEENPKENGAGNYTWWVKNTEIELIEKEKEMTNEEIWEMLKPKMEKNGLKSTTSTIRLPAKWCYGDPVDIVKSYEENMVHNAIALAYKVGYLRAIKGRPFKVGEKEKKKGGHWEPVDPNNLPEEGTKVRYARECEDYKRHDDWIQLNDTGVVEIEATWFGMTLDTPRGRMKWVCFDDAEDSLDMWVEDDA